MARDVNEDATIHSQRLLVGDPAARAYATDIDRRQCSRVKPLQVICVGLSRTGTSSLRQALIDLGFDDCYHMASILNENPREAEMWVEALQAKFEGRGKNFDRADWNKLLGHCMATTDTPSIVFWRELLVAYPAAKVILTVRDSAEVWHRSQMTTVQPFSAAMWPQKPTIAQRLIKLLSPSTALDRMFELLLKYHPQFQSGQHDLRYGTATSIEMYHKWNGDVIREVPKNRLLVLNLKDGWKPLCEFLGTSIPEKPFPRLNDGDVWQGHNSEVPRMVAAARQATVVKYSLSVAVIFIVAVGLVQLW